MGFHGIFRRPRFPAESPTGKLPQISGFSAYGEGKISDVQGISLRMPGEHGNAAVECETSTSGVWIWCVSPDMDDFRIESRLRWQGSENSWRNPAGRSQIFLLIPMNSHVIPNPTDEDGPKTTGRQDPKRQKSGFIQAPAFIEPRDPARRRADIPPGGRCSRTDPVMGRGRRIGQWQQPDPPLSFRPPPGCRRRDR